jgi:hypothetical protein
MGSSTVIYQSRRIDGRLYVERFEFRWNRLMISALQHVVRHSPTGFECGYGGSGPADLARSLLIDALGEEALCALCGGTRADPDGQGRCMECWGQGFSSLVESNYQALKRDIISTLPQDREWRLSAPELLDWLGQRSAREEAHR